MPPAALTFSNTTFMPGPIWPKAASGPVWGPMKPILMGAPSASGVVASAGQLVVGTWKAGAAAAELAAADEDGASVVAAAAAVVAAASVAAGAAVVEAEFESLPHEAATTARTAVMGREARRPQDRVVKMLPLAGRLDVAVRARP
jgi:hypothetical protein